MAGVTLHQVSKVFGGTVAVAPTDLEIDDGEFLVLVGPSGCGKTTTLRMIAGLEMPSEGSIRIDGEDVTYTEPKYRDIAMVFQNYALYPHMTVRQNMAYGLKMRSTPPQEIETRIQNTARMLGITALLDRYPRQLSGGQQQRVALGRAIVRYPKVFLMDEPLSNLDAKLRVQTRAELIKLHQQLKTTVVYVTHDQVEAMTMGTRIVVMKDGVIQQVGAPAEIYREPANMFVAAFVGSPPMQFLEGEAERRDGQLWFVGKGLELRLPDGGKFAGGKELSLGVRPENLMPVAVPADCEDRIPCRIEVVENIGAEVLCHCRTAEGEQLVMRLPTPDSPPAPGTDLWIRPFKGNLHLFDRQTGQTVYTGKVIPRGDDCV